MVAILFVALFAMAVRAPTDTDTWWHLQAGRVTLDNGRILQRDLFSHTRAGAPWVNHSWLSQIVLYSLFHTFYYAGLGIWMGAVVTLAFVFVYFQMEGHPFVRAMILIIAAATSAVIWAARPQLLSFLLTAVVSYILYLFKWRGINRLWLLPPIFALWVNLHAGYALGFMVLVAFVAGEVFNQVLELFIPADDPIVSWKGILHISGVALLAAIALVLNPNTTRMWTYYLETVRIGALQDFIQEWQSPDFHPLYTQPFIWLLLSTLGAVGISRRRVDGTDLALVTGFAYAALLAGRNLGPFALVCAPVLSRHVGDILRDWGVSLRSRSRFSPRLRAIFGAVNFWLLLLIIALAVVKVRQPLGKDFNEQLHEETLPVGAIAWIDERHPVGRMFNHYNWGGYLIWRLWPEYKVFVDGRTDLYGDEILGDYVEMQNAGPRTEDLLAEYEISFILTMRQDALSKWLTCREDWQRVYQDGISEVWQISP
jgi:hypothetical protein